MLLTFFNHDALKIYKLHIYKLNAHVPSLHAYHAPTSINMRRLILPMTVCAAKQSREACLVKAHLSIAYTAFRAAWFYGPNKTLKFYLFSIWSKLLVTLCNVGAIL